MIEVTAPWLGRAASQWSLLGAQAAGPALTGTEGRQRAAHLHVWAVAHEKEVTSVHAQVLTLNGWSQLCAHFFVCNASRRSVVSACVH